MAWGPRTLGSLLKPSVQAECKARFVHRYTGDHIPEWTRKAKKPSPLQFANDAEWLSNTVFRTRRDGELDGRFAFCESKPTWPNNPELR